MSHTRINISATSAHLLHGGGEGEQVVFLPGAGAVDPQQAAVLGGQAPVQLGGEGDALVVVHGDSVVLRDPLDQL